MQFEVSTSPHGMLCVQANDLTLRQCRIVRGVTRDNYADSPTYQLRTACSAFLQGYDEPTEHFKGWVLIEFWTDDRAAVDAFVAHLNERMRLDDHDTTES